VGWAILPAAAFQAAFSGQTLKLDHGPDKWEYNYLVRVKTSVTLPRELLTRLDRVHKNRSALLERAALAYLAQLERRERDRKDIEIIGRHEKRLNREATDTLGYQQLL
jgi:hypothetical protein